jgi:hypothetical protein
VLLLLLVVVLVLLLLLLVVVVLTGVESTPEGSSQAVSLVAVFLHEANAMPAHGLALSNINLSLRTPRSTPHV